MDKIDNPVPIISSQKLDHLNPNHINTQVSKRSPKQKKNMTVFAHNMNYLKVGISFVTFVIKIPIVINNIPCTLFYYIC